MPDADPRKPDKKPGGNRGRLTPEQRAEVLRRLKTGEKMAPIARDFGISREAVSQIRIRHLDPENARPSLRHKKRLTDKELATFRQTLQDTEPTDHELHLIGPEPREYWSEARVVTLAQKVLGKTPAAHVLKTLMQGIRPPPTYNPDAPPQYPLPHDVRRLSPELAADEEFVKYYLSPQAWELALRQYEYQLREYEKEAAARDAEAAKLPAPPPGPPSPPPRQRTGKHREGKGSPFTKPKKRRR